MVKICPLYKKAYIEGRLKKFMDIKEIAERNAHIPTEEILKDIADTEAEIAQMEQEAEHYSKTPLSAPTARLNHMRSDARRTGIKERKEFIEKLRAILDYRQKSRDAFKDSLERRFQEQ